MRFYCILVAVGQQVQAAQQQVGFNSVLLGRNLFLVEHLHVWK